MDREWRHVLAPFAPAPDDPEIARYLSVAAGEHVLLLPSEPSEWSLAQKSSGELGYVPTSYLEIVEVAPPSAPGDSWRRAAAIAEGDGRNSQTEARRSIAEVPRARRSSIHSTAL